MKTLTPKKPAKHERERLILFRLIELYLETGKPIGSHTLRESGFGPLSAATIRNYFAKLEAAGFLKQQHSSGGRIPTPLAYQTYAEAHLHLPLISAKEKRWIEEHLGREMREIALYLQSCAESLSELTHCAVFLSAPRFDQDFLLDIKLMSLDQKRLLCVLMTDFGVVHPEILYTDEKLSSFAIKRLENYFRWRLTGLDKPRLSIEEERMAERFYKEIMLRHIINYTHFSKEDLFQAGFSSLLHYPDFNDVAALANGLSLFENKARLHHLVTSCLEKGALSCWIGERLEELIPQSAACSLIAIPYRIHNTPCGVIGILGPNRLPYRECFGLLEHAAETISHALTRTMYKFKITFRQPSCAAEKRLPVTPAEALFLEDKTEKLCKTKICKMKRQ